MDYVELAPAHSTIRVSKIALGAMLMSTSVDEESSFAILDRYVERGGTFIDTADNYAYWLTGSQGGESEQLLGRWLKARGISDEVVIATKTGGRPTEPTTGISLETAGLAPDVVRESVRRSLANLGRDRIDLYYAHIPDPAVTIEDEVATFGELVADGLIGAWGLSNHWMWQVERAHNVSARTGVPRCSALQYHHSYVRARVDQASMRSPDGQLGVVTGDHLSYLRAHPGVPLVAYTPLLSGAYVRDDKPLGEIYQHQGNQARLDALAVVAKEADATANQVVLSWLFGGDLPIIPLVGVSSVAQLDELLDATELTLSAEQRKVLDEAG
jgi:aryl-alcohol dehydrogenase-like predicted oxidoreductase